MRYLYGKGVWAWMEHEVPRAIELAGAIGARFVLFKTGQAGTYYRHAARNIVRRIRDAGLAPIAWPAIVCRDPEAEAQVAIQSVLDGYAGLVFDLDQTAAGQAAGAVRLGEIVCETELPTEVMFYSSLPNISANAGIPYAEMARFCGGGFMPKAYAAFGWHPRYTIDVITYHAYQQWAYQARVRAPMYPVLSFFRDDIGEEPLTLGEIRAWLQALSAHRPTFFSVYRAGAIPEAAWPLLAQVETTPSGQAPPDDVRVDGRYITIQPGETVSALCLRYRCPVQQFWAWNGHLWDGVGRRRDPNLLEQGWIVRVG
ncbi:MAG: LysM peptidoglycan-binding domain-containing protein [Anaerolineae bacterium]|nr:LysM peptidoglycan-binding domain-containing protein [Anaerolineae bacterium]